MSVKVAPSNTSQLSEDELLELCLPAALLAACTVVSEEDARDAAQKACLELLLDRRQGRTIRHPKAYVGKIAKRMALAAKRTAARFRILEEAAGEEVVDAAEPALRLRHLVRVALDDMPKGQRAAVVLFDGDRLTGAEAGEIMGVSARAVHERVRVGRDRLARNCVELLCRRPGAPAGCPERGWRIWQLVMGKLEGSERQELEAHLEDCAYCHKSASELRYFKQTAAIAPIFPLDHILARKDDILRLVDGHLPPKATGSSTSSRWRFRLTVATAIAVTALLSVVPGVINEKAKPPAPAAAVAAVAPAPAPTTSPLPPVPNGGFAYLKSGDVYYQSDFSAAPVQLTNTGGLVDDWYWTGSGTSIIYKQRAPRSQAGDLHLVDLVSHQVTWSYRVGAAALAVSPDGGSYVAVLPTQIGTGYNARFSYRLLIGSIGSNPDPAREVDLSTVTSSQVVGYLTEYPPVNVRANFAGPAVWWTSAGIHFEPAVSDAGFDIDPNTKAVVQRQLSNVFAAERVYSGPTVSQITDVYGNLQVTSGGVTKIINFVSTHGPVMILSVSADESRGLATVLRSDGGHDVYLVTALGDVTPLSTDGSTLLAAWQPATTR